MCLKQLNIKACTLLIIQACETNGSVGTGPEPVFPIRVTASSSCLTVAGLAGAIGEPVRDRKENNAEESRVLRSSAVELGGLHVGCFAAHQARMEIEHILTPNSGVSRPVDSDVLGLRY